MSYMRRVSATEVEEQHGVSVQKIKIVLVN